MPVICFVDGGAPAVTRLAARQLLRFPGWNDGQIGYLACCQGADEPTAQAEPDLPSAALAGRELIAAVRTLQRSHEYVLLDASGTSDQIIALAVALSDVAVTPLCLDQPDHGSFGHAVDLVRIVSENLRRPEKHCVFLATRGRTPGAATLVQVSGLLAMKGLVTLPVPLCEWDRSAEDDPGAIGDHMQADYSAFAYGFFELVDRRFTPLVQQRRFG